MKSIAFVGLLSVSAGAFSNSCLPMKELFARDLRYEEATGVGDAAFLNDLLADEFVWFTTRHQLLKINR